MSAGVLALKNATRNFGRTLTLALFSFLTALLVVVLYAFTNSVRDKTANVLVRGLTGHLQVRSADSFERDMAAQNGNGWYSLDVMPALRVERLRALTASVLPGSSVRTLVRGYAYLAGPLKEEQLLAIGLAPESDEYRDAFLLAEGTYLSDADPSLRAPILLGSEQARAVGVGLGGTVTLRTRRPDGLSAEGNFTVVGIGDFVLLSLFSWKAAYARAEDMRSLLGLEDGAATDLVLELEAADGAPQAARLLDTAIAAAGIESELTADSLVTREDVGAARYTTMDAQDADDSGVKVSDWTEMGETFLGIGGAISAILAFLAGFLVLVVCLLIVNLVTLIGIERVREIGTLRSLGFGEGFVLRMFLGEIAFGAGLGGFLGSACACAVLALSSRAGFAPPLEGLRYIMGDRLAIQADPVFGLIVCFALTILVVVAAFFPARRACSISPAAAIRSL